MKHPLFPFLACPLDGLPLTQHEKHVSCTSGHSFDFDRKGTLNLLPVQFKKSKHPGDSKEMIIARETLLNSGLYQPISDKLNELVAEHTATIILDAGCGEGYYTQRLSTHLPHAAIAGLDISKDAIQSAAKRSRNIQWIVGTNANIPIIAHSIDCVLCLFGFPVWPEFSRILKPGGIVIMADPGPDHLIELRRVLYPEIKTKPETEKTVPETFQFPQIVTLNETVPAPPPSQIKNLLTMTPHGYRARQENIQKAIDAIYSGLTINILFSIYYVNK